jgi:hypothetical protein
LHVLNFDVVAFGGGGDQVWCPLLGTQISLFYFYLLVSLCRGKANFFERRVGDYQKASVMSSLQDGGKNYVFKMDEDF